MIDGRELLKNYCYKCKDYTEHVSDEKPIFINSPMYNIGISGSSRRWSSLDIPTRPSDICENCKDDKYDTRIEFFKIEQEFLTNWVDKLLKLCIGLFVVILALFLLFSGETFLVSLFLSFSITFTFGWFAITMGEALIWPIDTNKAFDRWLHKETSLHESGHYKSKSNE